MGSSDCFGMVCGSAVVSPRSGLSYIIFSASSETEMPATPAVHREKLRGLGAPLNLCVARPATRTEWTNIKDAIEARQKEVDKLSNNCVYDLKFVRRRKL